MARDQRDRLPRLLCLFALFVLLGAACGTRLSEEQVEALLSAETGTESGLEGGGILPPAETGEVALPEEPGTGPGGGPGGGPAPPAGSGSAAGSTACTDNPGATDVGVTATRVFVGATYAESSLVPGQFRPAMDGIQAYVNLVNRRGGICGRLIDFHFHNDELNAQRYAENVRHLVEQDEVFAMLGNISAADSGACGYLSGQEPPDGVPDIGTFALSYCRSQAPNHYGPVGSLRKGIYGCCPDWDYLRDQFGFTQPAAHWLDIEISRDQGFAVVDALVRTLGLDGRDDVYQGEHSPAQFSYTGDVNEMRNQGVDGVWSSMDLNNNVKLVRAMCQQNWRPKVVHVEISSYDPAFLERVGADCIQSQNIVMRALHIPFYESNEEMRLYLATLSEFCPSCSPTTFGLEGWLTAKLFVELLEKIGPDLTRERLYQELDAVENWTADGVIGPITPSDRIIYSCNVLMHFHPDGFHQHRGFACGKFYRSGDYTGPPVGP
jgi:ABC-type branched-subunit amino acid transport system substrate-binding protein